MAAPKGGAQGKGNVQGGKGDGGGKHAGGQSRIKATSHDAKHGGKDSK